MPRSLGITALLPSLALLLVTGCDLFPEGDGTDDTGDDATGGLTEGDPSTISATSWITTGDESTDDTSEPTATSTTSPGDPSGTSGSDHGMSTDTDIGEGTDTDGGEGTSTGTTDGGEETDGTTGGEDPPPAVGCEMDCNPGCEEIIVTSLQGQTALWHAGTSRMAHDETGRVVLWTAPNDDVVAIFDAVDSADLAGATAAIEQAGTVSMRNSADGLEVGTVDVTGASWGLARDGSYVWVADAASLRVFETDGVLRWERPGNYASAQVLPLPGAVHVHAPATGASVEDVDAVTGMASALPFLGTFDGWFHDQPRFWTLQGDAFRLYDTDGSLMAFDIGNPRHGYGDWLVTGNFSAVVVAVTDVATPVVTLPDSEINGAGLIGDFYAGDAELIRLDQAVLMPQVVSVPCCSSYGPRSFAFEGGEWLLGDDEGQVGDDQGDVLSAGDFQYVHGSTAGTFGLTSANATTSLWEVTPACVRSELSTISRAYAQPGRISGDGSTFLSVTRIPQVALDLHDTATGAAFDTTVYGLSTSTHVGIQVSDAADLFGLRSINTGVSNTLVLDYPGWGSWLGGQWAHTPAIAPNGLLAVRNDAVYSINATFEGSLSYVHDAAGLVSIFDGVTHGFVDDSTLLVAHYAFVPGPGLCWHPGECDVLVSVELVDTTGVPIAVSPIPDPANFERVSSTEVFLPEPPTIVDVYTGAVLWSGPPGPAAPVGLDHVAHAVGGDLVLTKWR